MNSKRQISKVLNIMITVAAIYYGAWFIFAIVYYGLSLVIETDSLFEVMGAVSFYGFMVPNLSGIVSGITAVALIVTGAVYAFREQNIRNLFNVNLLGTIALIIITVALQISITMFLF